MPRQAKALARLFPNTVRLHPPEDEPAAHRWKQAIEKDVAACREANNRRCGRPGVAAVPLMGDSDRKRACTILAQLARAAACDALH